MIHPQIRLECEEALPGEGTAGSSPMQQNRGHVSFLDTKVSDMIQDLQCIPVRGLTHFSVTSFPGLAVLFDTTVWLFRAGAHRFLRGR